VLAMQHLALCMLQQECLLLLHQQLVLLQGP
jgi:hypothetical protein